MKTKDAILNMLFPEGIKCIVCDGELWERAENGLCGKCSLPENTSFCLKCGRVSKAADRFCLDCQSEYSPVERARAPFAYEGGAKKLVYGLKYGNRRYLVPYMARFMADYFSGCIKDFVSNDKGEEGGDCDDIYSDSAAGFGTGESGEAGDNGRATGECSIDCAAIFGTGEADNAVPLPRSFIDFVTFAPMNVKRQRRRGYNQAELLAREVARLLGLPVAGVLDRLPGRKNAARLRAFQRKELLRGLISVIPGVSFAGKNILLIDDVFTTGATAEECALRLLESGAAGVYVLTFATSRVRINGRIENKRE